MKLTKNFHLSEFNCRTVSENGEISDEKNIPVPVDLIPNVQELAFNLQVLRDFLGVAIHINSGYRTKEYNATLSGAVKNSQHLLAKAADITCARYTPAQVHAAIEELILEGKMKDGGLGIYNTFCHYDIRDNHKRWDFRTHK